MTETLPLTIIATCGPVTIRRTAHLDDDMAAQVRERIIEATIRDTVTDLRLQLALQ